MNYVASYLWYLVSASQIEYSKKSKILFQCHVQCLNNGDQELLNFVLYYFLGLSGLVWNHKKLILCTDHKKLITNQFQPFNLQLEEKTGSNNLFFQQLGVGIKW